MDACKQEADHVISQEILEFLIRNIPILGALSDEELLVIERYLNFIELCPGEVVFQEGDRGDYVYFVLAGSLEVIKESKAKEEVVISVLTKGCSIGEMAVIDDLPRSATVRACTKATLLTLSRENFNYLLTEHSGIAAKLLKAISQLLSLNLRRTSTRLANSLSPNP